MSTTAMMFDTILTALNTLAHGICVNGTKEIFHHCVSCAWHLLSLSMTGKFHELNVKLGS